MSNILSGAGYDTEMRTSQLLVFASVLAALSLAASAQEYPAKAIRVITPYGAGGASDIVVRAGVHEMSKQLGQAIIVENRTGAGGTIGFEAFATSPADGYTLLGTASSLHGIAAALYTKTLNHDPNKDIEPIIVFANVSNVLVVNPSVNAKSTKELIELARKEPGKLTFVSAGVGTSLDGAARRALSTTTASGGATTTSDCAWPCHGTGALATPPRLPMPLPP